MHFCGACFFCTCSVKCPGDGDEAFEFGREAGEAKCEEAAKEAAVAVRTYHKSVPSLHHFFE
jgi:hypothetical protein